ncbi:transcriptional regulator [Mycobacterium sp. JS623]|uniref:MarR family winged helix-turn-helix transcriptional regulator n=1 Tax=Mycobacterium sp. JS623 TaxID=212767 RepID=UPI0002A58E23|nr:MarR family transcriptional regulator [Mycobacterium sp. JS623]AGB22318.1 transcriptional regulator [Mycobacterium sp. JS623]
MAHEREVEVAWGVKDKRLDSAVYRIGEENAVAPSAGLSKARVPRDEPLGYLLNRVYSSFRSQVTAKLATRGLAFPQYLCMRMLSRAAGASNAELARALGVSPQATNVLVQELIERGLLERPPTVLYGRARPITLTAKGVLLLDQMERLVREAELCMLKRVTPRQRRDLKQILSTLGWNL